jgi:NarL family two-component system response regulator LiaR
MKADQRSSGGIRILIVDDHTVVRDGLNALLSAEPGMQVVGAAGDGEGAVRLERELAPDVILLDLVMPRMDGVQATRQIKRQNPQARILVLTSFGEDHQVFAAIKAGASGYMMKDTSSDELIQAIRDTYAGAPVMQPEIAQKLMREIQNQDDAGAPGEVLTEREIEILQHLAQGKSNQQIADDLFLSERTVRTHITNILSKLGLSNRTQAVLYALREGIAHIPYTREDEGQTSD